MNPTLRQCQRFLARRARGNPDQPLFLLRGADPDWPGLTKSGVVVCHGLELKRFSGSSLPVASLRTIDRLVSRFGPKTTLKEVVEALSDRPKDTDEVQEDVTHTSEDVHGGDGNSGEVNHAATIARQDRQGLGEDSHAEAPETVSPADDDESPELAISGLGENREDEPTADVQGESDAAGGTRDGGQEADQAPATAEAQEGAESPEGNADQPGRDGRDDQHRENSTEASSQDCVIGSGEDGRHSPGNSDPAHAGLDSAMPKGNEDTSESAPKGSEDVEGETHSPSQQATAHRSESYLDKVAAERRARLLSKPGKEVDRAFRRLAATEVGIGLEPSPRLSGKRLIRELAGRSYRISRAHREEMQPSCIVIAVDCSGSCSACCNDTFAAAKAIEQSMPESVLVVEHSNGYLDRQSMNDPLYTLDEYVERIKKTGKRIACVVNFGDWDAGDQLQAIVENGTDLIWLDSFGKIGGVRLSTDNNHVLNRWAGGRVLKYDGIDGASCAAIAIRDAMKRWMKRWK